MLTAETLFYAVCSFCVILSVGIFVYLRRNFNYWLDRNVVGPKPRTLTGTFPKSAAGQCNLVEELHEIYLKYKDKQKYVGVFSGRNPKLFILDPKLAAEVLKHNFSSFHDNESSKWTSLTVEQLRPYSPFVSTGDDWKNRRNELSPALATSHLRAFFPALCDSAAALTKFLESNESEDCIDAKELANRFTTQFIANFIWGIEASAFNDSAPCTIQQMADAMIVQALASVRSYGRTASWPWLRRVWPVRFFPQQTDRFFKGLVSSITKLRTSKPVERCDVLNHLLQLQSKVSLNDEQIAGHTTTVLIDGFETAAIVTAHCLLLLSRSQRVQAKLRSELLGYADEISFETLNEMPYLDQCIQETLRIFPPLPTLFKLCTEPTSLENFDDAAVTLQLDDVVYISSYSFHRDANFYENPERFWPERFDAEFGGVRRFRDMGVFLPFGDGPRMCLGMKLGLIETKMAVAEIVRHFEISSCSPTREDNKIAANSFLLRLDGDIKLSFKKVLTTTC